MSEIRVNTIVAAEGTSAPNLPYGIQVPTGMGITGAGGVNITGIITAANFDGTINTGAAGTFGGVVKVTDTTESTSVSSGALIISGGAGVAKNLFVGDTLDCKDINVSAAATITGALSAAAISGSTGTFSGAVNVDATTDSTSATSGALIVDGGLGVAKNVYIGAGLSVAGTLTYEDVTNVDSVGLITAKSGVNVTGGQLQVGVAYSVGAAGVCTAAGFVGPLTGNVTGNASGSSGSCTGNSATASNATNFTVADESSDTTCFPVFVTAATGDLPPKSGSNLTFNSSTGALTATSFVGDVTGNLNGTVNTAAQTNITSLGSLSSLAVTGTTTLNDDLVLAGASYNVSWDKSANYLQFADNAKAVYGAGADLSLYHNGSHSFIDETGTGNLYIRAGTDNGITLNSDADVILYYDNSLKFQTTNDGTVTTGIATFTQGANFDGILSEKFNTVAGKLSDNTTIDLEDGMIHFFTTTESTTSTPNIRYSSSKTLNNMLTIGDTVSVTVITTAAAAGYSENWQVDGTNVTEEWNGGSAPSEGGAGGYDVYTITLLKTSNATFTVLANLSNFA